MIRTAFILLLFTLPFCLKAQNEGNEIDLIKSKLHQANKQVERAGLYNDLAWEYSFTNFDSSEKYTLLALDLSKEIKDDYWISVSMEMLALLKEISGHPEEAIKLYFEVIEIRTRLNGQGLENTYNNMAILFKGQMNHTKAYEYFRKSYEIEKQNANKHGIAGSLINMAISLKDLGQSDSSFHLLKDALIIANEVNDEHLIANANLNIANYYNGKSMLDSALYYNNLIIIASEKSGSTDGLTSALIGAGIIHVKKKEYKEAIVALDKAESLALKINALEYLKRIYSYKTELYKALNNYSKAFSYQEKYIAANDSLLNSKTISVLNELEKKYESAQKEGQIAQLELENKSTALLLEQSENQRNIFIFSTLIVLILAGFITYLFYSKKKLNKVLETKNNIIQIALDEKEILLKEIHHRVKNNLQVISSLLSLQSRYIKDDNAAEAIKEGKNRVKSMAMIHQKLYQKDNLTGIDIHDYFENLIESLFDSYGVDRSKINYELHIDTIRLDVDTTIPLGLILNELITNSLKHAFKEASTGKLAVTLRHNNDMIKLEVSDNGKGMPDVVRTGSFGMSLIESLAKKLKATTSIDTSKGTSYIVDITKFKLV